MSNYDDYYDRLDEQCEREAAMEDAPRRRRTYYCGPERLCGSPDCRACFPTTAHIPDEDDDEDEPAPPKPLSRAELEARRVQYQACVAAWYAECEARKNPAFPKTLEALAAYERSGKTQGLEAIQEQYTAESGESLSLVGVPFSHIALRVQSLLRAKGVMA